MTRPRPHRDGRRRHHEDGSGGRRAETDSMKMRREYAVSLSRTSPMLHRRNDPRGTPSHHAPRHDPRRDDPRASPRHQHRCQREPSGMRISEIMESRQDYDDDDDDDGHRRSDRRRDDERRDEAWRERTEEGRRRRDDAPPAAARDDDDRRGTRGGGGGRRPTSSRPLGVSASASRSTSVSNSRSTHSASTSVSNTVSDSRSGTISCASSYAFSGSRSTAAASRASRASRGSAAAAAVVGAREQAASSPHRPERPSEAVVGGGRPRPPRPSETPPSLMPHSISQSRSDCNASRMTGNPSMMDVSMATPRASNLQTRDRTRTPKLLELEPLAEDRSEDRNNVAKSRPSPSPSTANKIEPSERGRGRPPPTPSIGKPPRPPATSPRSESNVAVDGRNSTDRSNADPNKNMDDTTASIFSSGHAAFRRLLRRSPSEVSTITGFTMENFPDDEDDDRGIDPTKGSFDLVIVSKSESKASGSRGSRSGGGGSGKGGRRRKPPPPPERAFSAADAVSAAASSVKQRDAADGTVATCDTRKLTYWSSLSVRAALAVMQARGNEVVAQRAANAVLEEGKKRRPTDDLRTLATHVSIVVMECGGDHRAAAAVAVAIMNEQRGDSSLTSRDKTVSSSERDGPLVAPSGGNESVPDKASKLISEEWLRARPSEQQSDQRTEGTTPSMASRRRLLREKEEELEEAARRNEERERALEERMRELAEAEMDKAAEEAEAEAEAERAAAGRAAARSVTPAARAAAEKARRRKEHEAAARRALREKEEEIERQARALEERARAMQEAERARRERARAEQAAAEARRERMSGMNLDEIYASFETDDVDGATLPSTTASMASARRYLEEKEREIAERNRELEETARANREREDEIRKRMEALDAAKAAVASKAREQRERRKKEEKRRMLKEKEEEVSRMNQELEEAARFNAAKEREIAERMAALDAATAALLERADNVQNENDQTTNDGGDGSALGRVDEDSVYEDGGGGDYSRGGDRSAAAGSLHPPRKQHGEFSVGSDSRSHEHHGYAPRDRDRGDDDRRDESSRAGEEGDDPAGGFPHEGRTPTAQRGTGTENGSVLEQLTGRLYSILDMACDSSVLVARTVASAEETATKNTSAGDSASKAGTKEEEEEEEERYAAEIAASPTKEEGEASYYSRQEASSYYSRKDEERAVDPSYPEPLSPQPHIKAPTLSGLTDDQRTWASRHGEREGGEYEAPVTDGGISDEPIDDDAAHPLSDGYAKEGRITIGLDRCRSDDESQRRPPRDAGGDETNEMPGDAPARAMERRGLVGRAEDPGRSPSRDASRDGEFLDRVLRQAASPRDRGGAAAPPKGNVDINQALSRALSQAMGQAGATARREATTPPARADGGPRSALRTPKCGVVTRPPPPKRNAASAVVRAARMRAGFLGSFSRRNASSPAASPPPSDPPPSAGASRSGSPLDRLRAPAGVTRSRSPFASFSRRAPSSPEPNRPSPPASPTRSRSPGNPMKKFGRGDSRPESPPLATKGGEGKASPGSNRRPGRPPDGGASNLKRGFSFTRRRSKPA